MFTIAGGWKLRLKRYSEGRLVFKIKILLETRTTKSVGRGEAGFCRRLLAMVKFCQFHRPIRMYYNAILSLCAALKAILLQTSYTALYDVGRIEIRHV